MVLISRWSACKGDAAPMSLYSFRTYELRGGSIYVIQTFGENGVVSGSGFGQKVVCCSLTNMVGLSIASIYNLDRIFTSGRIYRL